MDVERTGRIEKEFWINEITKAAKAPVSIDAVLRLLSNEDSFDMQPTLPINHQHSSSLSNLKSPTGGTDTPAFKKSGSRSSFGMGAGTIPNFGFGNSSRLDPNTENSAYGVDTLRERVNESNGGDW